MSVKFVLLSLLRAQNASVYQLRAQFEQVTGQAWNLNIGQVSTTMQRLERDGLAVRVSTSAEAEPYAITDAGRAALSRWWDSPVDRARPERSELVMKIVAATVTPDIEVQRVIQTQRRHLLETMRDFTRLKRQADEDLTWRLVLENHLFVMEAELRWLDHVQLTLKRSPGYGKEALDAGADIPKLTQSLPAGKKEPARNVGGSRE